MNDSANLTLWLELILVAVSTGSYLYWFSQKETPAVRFIARYSYYGFTLFSTIASAVLMMYFLNHNFNLQYVAEYSSRELELHYLISSFWAGQEGSFLLWILLSAWLGIIVLRKAGDMEPQVMFFYNLSNLFLSILLINQTPFKLLPETPIDGNGLNMLLQDPWMVIHPPLVFLGYAAFTVPFAFALAGYWRREYDRWITKSISWAVFAFVILGAGIIIGGYWAYKVLGWGGYWGWDPVENASLLPWLTGTALMHGMLFQCQRGHLRKTNFILAAVSFLLIIYSTFLTRSGILADFSVHSFVDLGITGWLVFFIFGFLLLSAAIFILRVKDIPKSTKSKLELDLYSKEAAFGGAIVIMVIFTILIGIGTSFPIISKLFSKGMKVPNSYYVNADLPFAIIMLILLSYGPLLVWGRNQFNKIFPEIIWGAGAGVLAAVISLLFGFTGISNVLVVLFAGVAAGVNLLLTVKLVQKNLPISGAAITHFGVGLMFMAFVASSAYDSSQRLALREGETKTVLGADLTFMGPQYEEKGSGGYLYMPLQVKYGGATFKAMPDIYTQMMPHGQPNRYSHPFIYRELIADLYISPEGFDPGEVDSMAMAKLTLKKGGTLPYKDYEISFSGYNMLPPESDASAAAHSMRVGANISVSYKGGPAVKLQPIFNASIPDTPEGTVKLPGPDGRTLRLVKINASDKTIEMHYAEPVAADGVQAKPTPIAFLEVNRKPGMTLLWIGIVLILFGGTVSIFRKCPVPPSGGAKTKGKKGNKRAK